MPPSWFGLLVKALRLVALGELGKAADLRAEAFEAAEETSVSIDGMSSSWIADTDSRLGPVCEIIINGQYYWLPFSLLGELRFEGPEDLRDFVWTPAQLGLANGGQQVALIPSRYPGGEGHDDDRIRLYDSPNGRTLAPMPGGVWVSACGPARQEIMLFSTSATLALAPELAVFASLVIHVFIS